MSQASDGTASQVLNAVDDDVIEAATAAGVDVDEVVETQVEKHSDYGINVIANFVTAELNQRVEAATAEEVKGILAGSRDRHGRNWPRRLSLLRSSGDHLEVSTWSGSIPTSDGTEIDLPHGSVVGMRVSQDPEYDSYEAVSIDTVTEIGRSDLVERLNTVALNPAELTPALEYDVVVVRGEIRFVNPQSVFEDGEYAGDGPVMVEDERGELQPHIEFGLQQDGNTRVRGHIERQAYGRPMFPSDLGKLCRDAFELEESPEAQAQFVQMGLQGLDVLLVGNINSYDVDSDSSGQPVHYVDIAATSIIEIPGQKTSLEQYEDEPEPEPTDTGGETVGIGGEAPDPDVADDEGRTIDDVEGDIIQYCDLTGTDVNTLSVDTVNDSLDLDDPDAVIQTALDRLQDGESDDEPEPEPAGDAGGLETDFPNLVDSGMLHCPFETSRGECQFQAGNDNELLIHVTDQHSDEVESLDEAKEQLGGA